MNSQEATKIMNEILKNNGKSFYSKKYLLETREAAIEKLNNHKATLNDNKSCLLLFLGMTFILIVSKWMIPGLLIILVFVFFLSKRLELINEINLIRLSLTYINESINSKQ